MFELKWLTDGGENLHGSNLPHCTLLPSDGWSYDLWVTVVIVYNIVTHVNVIMNNAKYRYRYSKNSFKYHGGNPHNK